MLLAVLWSPVRADQLPVDGAARAAEHDRRGRQAFVEGRYEDCIREYKKASVELSSERFAYNIAKCSERAKNLAQAITYYRRYLEMSGGAKDADEVQLLVRVLEEQERAQRGVRLVRMTSEPASEVSVRQGASWRPLGTTPVEVELPVGPAALRFALEGYQDRLVDADVQEPGQAVVAMLQPTPTPEPVAVAGPIVVEGGPDDRSPELGTAGWVTAGIGVAVVGGAVAMSLLSVDRAEEANGLDAGSHTRADFQALRDDSELFGDLAIVGYAVGGAAVATGVTLLVLEATGEPQPITFAPVLSPSGLGGMARVTF